MLGRILWKIEKRFFRTIRRFRVPCSGDCGRMVLRNQGECRHCRKARLHAGLKRIRKAARGS